MRSSILLILLSLMFASCAQKSSQVSLKLSSSFAFGGASLASYSEGGLMVWGMSGDGKSFGKVLSDTDSLTLNLPNGDWTFYAMAWDTPSSIPMSTATGTARCAQSLPIKLDGAPQAPALELTQTNCNSTMFKGSLTGSTASLLTRLRVCESVDGILTSADTCTNDRTDINRKSDKAPAMSVRITLADYGNGVGIVPGTGLSRCIQMTNDQTGQWMSPGPGSLFIPSGDPTRPAAAPFRVDIELHNNGFSCVDPNPIKIALPNSFVSIQSGKKHFFSGVSENILSIAVPDSMVCGNGRAIVTPFSGGDGTSNFPYVICTASQLHQLINSGTYLANSFRLSADINLNNFAKNIAADADLPTDADCWGPAQTWQPIGLTYGVSPACAISSAGTVSGSFDGNNHKIIGMRMRMESQSTVGFIGTWAPAVAESYLRDLVFENVDISAGSEMGTLLGGKFNAVVSEISNIKVVNAQVESRGNPADSGGIVGQIDNADLVDLSITGSTIKAEGGTIGGIFGISSNARKILRLHSRTHIIPRYSEANMGQVGGVGGSVSSNVLAVNGIGSLSHEGILIANSPQVGGIFAYVANLVYITPAPAVIQNVYASSAIMARGTAPNNVGGLFGSSAHAGSFANGLFTGTIIDKCSSACMRGNLVGSDTGPATSVTGYFYSATNAISAQGSGDSGNFAGATAATDTNLYLSTYEPATFNTPPFIHVNGDIPRLISESHPCSANAVSGVSNRDLLTTQASQRGSLSNPIVVCRKDQLEQLSSVTGTRRVRLATGIGLKGGYTRPSLATGVTLDGHEGYIHGYTVSGSGGVGEVRSPFNQNNGIIQNLLIANLEVDMLPSGGSGSGLAGLVGINNGVIRNSAVLSGSMVASTTVGTPAISGIAHNNNGTIDNVSMEANILARSRVSGITSFNSGTITNSRVSSVIRFNGGSTQHIYGIADANSATGVISRSKIEGSIIDGGYPGNNISFFAGTNTGTITDSEVGSSARWHFPLTSDMSTVAITNTGVIRRMIIGGSLLNTDNTAVTNSSTTGRPVVSNSGVTEGVITMYPAGRHIGNTSGTNITCSAVDRFTISTGMPGGGALQPGATYWTTFVGSAQMVWVVAEEQGNLRLARIINVVTPSGTMDFQIDRPCTELAMAGNSMVNVRIIQDYATAIAIAAGNTTASPYNGMLYGQDNNLVGSSIYMGPWASQFYEPESVPADLDTLIAHYTAILSGQNSTLSRAWEFSSGWGMELVNKN